MPHATATLQDLFELPSTGVIAVVAGIEGVIHLGDRVTCGGRHYAVKGLESIRTAEPRPRPADNIGLLIGDAPMAELRPLIGTILSFDKAEPDPCT